MAVPASKAVPASAASAVLCILALLLKFLGRSPDGRTGVLSGPPSASAAVGGPPANVLRAFERIVHHADPVLGLLVVCGPFGVEVRQRLGGDHLLLALALVEQLLDAIARSYKHFAECNEIGLGGEFAMAGHDLGLVVRHLDVGIERPDQSPDVAS